jgi:hypothetical protein
VRLRVAWSGSDPDVISSYRLDDNRAATGWRTLALASPTATSHTLLAQPGDRWQFRVRATDTLGATSVPDYARAVIPRLRQESHPAITLTGTWKAQAIASTAGGAVRYATRAGDKAALTFQGSSVAWVAMTGPGCGKASVYLDGVFQGTVDLYRATSQSRPIVWSANNLTPGVNHTLELRVLGQKHAASTGKRVDLDAIVFLQ